YTGYQNYRLLDEIDQLLFIYDHCNLASSNPPPAIYLPFWRAFAYLVARYSQVTGYRWSARQNYLPHRWLRANAAAVLFNRIVEDRIAVNQLAAQGGIQNILANAYQAYVNSLEVNRCCDFAHLQYKFLEFLGTPTGQRFLIGNGSIEHPGINYVLVDEYQDT